MEIIRIIVKEKGVANLIMSYKKRFEWVEILQQYTNGEDLTVDWIELTKNTVLSEDFIHDFKDNVNWLYICTYQSLSEKFIEEHKSYIRWRWISKYQKLSLKFIRKYKKVLNWDLICTYQKLSSTFIEEHHRYVRWLKIANHQNDLDPRFLAIHKNDIRRDMIIMDYYDAQED